MAEASTERLGFKDQILSLDKRFWIVNILEMFERFSYFSLRAVVAIYMVLATELGGPQFSHAEKGTIFFWWAGVQCIVPIFSGGYADRYGYKKTIAFSTTLNIIGYIMMAHLTSFGGFLSACLVLALGTAFFKPALQGTLAATLKKNNASMGWGVFYQLVNVGGFIGPIIAGVLRLMDWQYVFYCCALIISMNYIWLFFFDDPSKDFEVSEKMKHPMGVFVNTLKGFFRPRVFIFCLVFSGFWLMAYQVFDILPNVIDDWVDSSGVIKMLGTAFSNPYIPTLLAIVVAGLFGVICSGTVFLSLRPDYQKIEDNSKATYVFIGFVFWAVFFFVLKIFLAGVLLYAGSALLAIISAVLSWHFKISAKRLIITTFTISAISIFFILKDFFITSAPSLVQLAKDGKQVNPEWMINLNPALIVCTMVFFAYLASFVRPLTSIIIGMLVATIGAFLAGTAVLGWICIAGIFVFSVGEMLSSPKKSEYLASLAPKGQSGLYMGYVNFTVAIGWMAGSLFAGNYYEHHGDKVNLAKQHLINVVGMGKEAVAALNKTDVMPTLATKLNMSVLEAQHLLFDTYHPEKLWYYISAIGLSSLFGMLIYDRAIRWYDKKHGNV
ncbi:MAG: MFS transporter [bacterium]|nr:MFS transporter [bacterium]MBU1916805.1 MFS transporter [bacterium]